MKNIKKIVIPENMEIEGISFVEGTEIYYEEADVEKVVKDLQGNFSGSNEEQMAGVQMLKGLATSDDELANKFMIKLDKATTDISKEVLGNMEEQIDDYEDEEDDPMYGEYDLAESQEKLDESNYGWEIKRGKEWDALEELIEYFGAESVLDQLAQAMGTNELSENLAYIYRMNDLSDSPYIK